MVRALQLTLLALLALLAGSAHAWNRRVAVVVFGDSLSDTGAFFRSPFGRNRTAPRSPPYFQGRFTTAPGTWVDQIPRYVKWPASLIAPNFAFAGSTACRYDFLPPAFAALPTVEAQVDQYLAALAQRNGTLATRTRGYTRVPWLWLGANDVQYLSFAPADRRFAIGAALPGNISTCLTSAARKLIQNGHKHVVISTLAPFELTPLAIRTNNSAIAAQLVTLINGAITAAASQLQSAYPNATVVVSTVHADITGAIRNLTAGGFKFGPPASCFNVPVNFSSSSGDVPTSICARSSDYVFIDTLHPTPAGHRVVVRSVLKTLVNVLKLFPWANTRYVPLAK